MAPEKLIELLSAYADGEVSPAERDEVERLLASDPEAQALYRRLTSTTSMLKTMERVQAPPTLRHILRTRMVTSREIPFFQRMRLLVEKRRLRMSQLAYLLSFFVIIGMLYFISSSLLQRNELETASIDIEFPEQEEEIVEAVRFARNEPQVNEYILPAEDEVEVPPVESPFPLYEGPSPEPPVQYALDAAAPDDAAASAGETGQPMAAPAPRSQALAAETRTREPVPQPETHRTDERAAGRMTTDALARTNKFITPEDEAKAKEETAAHAQSPFVLEGGRNPIINSEAQPGSDANPLRADISFTVNARDLANQPMLPGGNDLTLSGRFNVAASGRIVWYRIEGPPAAQPVMETFIAHLRASAQEPQVLNGRPVAIAYTFTATIVSGR